MQNTRRKRSRSFRKLSLILISPLFGHAFTSPFGSRHRSFEYQSSSVYQSFKSLTVPQLKQLVRESYAERGVLSRLKKKDDLIKYLEQNAVPGDSTGEESERLSSQDQRKDEEENKPRRRPKSMPALTSTNQNRDPATITNPKEAVFERVYQRYPPLRDTPEEKAPLPAEDIRQLLHPVFQHRNASSDMDVVFVGTASCTPGLTRGVSCTALRLNWRGRNAFAGEGSGSTESGSQRGTWIFDVGECTQLQIQRSTAIRPSKISKIFLTHAHGDHTLGLVGLLCLIGQDRERDFKRPLEIYGPEGLRMWLRVAIRYSVSRIVPPYRVHELMDVPIAPEWKYNHQIRRYFHGRFREPVRSDQWGTKGMRGEDGSSWITQAPSMPLRPSHLYGEADGGRSIAPIYNHPRSADGAPVWEVEDEEDVKVFAAPMSHGVPCVGYVVEECSRPGRLRNEYVEPIVRRNVQALQDAGFKVPMKAMAVIKNLPPGGQFTFPDKTVVTQEDAVEPPRKGRKVVICGDTSDCRSMRGLAQDADLIIHEATNAYLAGVDRGTSLEAVTRDAIVHGHSTPQMAGKFCRDVNGKRLALNHFSARYKGDVSLDSMAMMMRIENQALKAAGLNETQVIASWDMMVLPIPQN